MTKRIIVTLALVFALSVGVTGATITTEAVTQTEAVAQAWPWDGIDIKWGCIMGIGAFGFGVVTTALLPPAGMTMLFLYSAVGVYGAYATADTCANEAYRRHSARASCLQHYTGIKVRTWVYPGFWVTSARYYGVPCGLLKLV